MKFYSIDIAASDYDDSIWDRNFSKLVRDKQIEFFEKNGSDTYVFICMPFEFCVDDAVMMVGVFTSKDIDVKDYVEAFFKTINIKADVRSIKERCLSTALSEVLELAVQEGFLESENEVLERFGMENIHNARKLIGGVRCWEGGIPDAKDDLSPTNKALYLAAEETLKDEINADPDTAGCYLVSTDEADTAYAVDDLLIKKLYKAGIISDKHYFVIDMVLTNEVDYCEELYNIFDGRTIIVNLFDNRNIVGNKLRDKAKRIAEIADKHTEVVTVFNVQSNSPELKGVICDNIKVLSLVEINEKPLSADKSREYLSNRVMVKGLAVDAGLLDKLDNNKLYRAAKLDEIFSEWLHEKKFSYEEARSYIAAFFGYTALSDDFPLVGWLDDTEAIYDVEYLDGLLAEQTELTD
jgi:hypothetical protein